MKKGIVAIGICVILLLVVFSSGCIDFSGEEKEKNKEPIADAGPDQTVYVGDIVYLNGTGSDPDGTIILFEWDFDGDGTYDWSSPTSGHATHTYNIAGAYVAMLRVTDNDGATDKDIAIITVTELYTDLLKNSGFEDGAGDDPLYWYRAMVPASGLELSWDNEIKHSGNKSVSISNTHVYEEVVCNNWAQNIIENIPIGETLELEGGIKMIEAESVNICIQCWSEDYDMLAFKSTQVLNGTADWGNMVASITVPSGTTMITVRASLTGTGQVWFDDITLVVK